MVVFTCGHCGESVQKPKVEKHYLTKCRNRNPNLSCMDCFKDFPGDTYESHTKCVTEEERYSGKGFQAKEKKGEKKQNTWVEMLQSVLDQHKNAVGNVRRIIETVSKHNNVPRKKPKFVNFVKNVCGMKTNPKDIDQAWDLISVKLSDLSNANNQNKNQQKKQDNFNGKADENGDDSVINGNADEEGEKLNGNTKKEKNVVEAVNDEEPVNGDNNKVTTNKKLSKKQRKEEKKRQKYEAELQSVVEPPPQEEEIQENQPTKKGKKKKSKSESSNGDAQETEESKKNKKRKRQDTVCSVPETHDNGTENIENEPVATTKVSKKKQRVQQTEEADESICLHDQNVARIDELHVNSDKFNWHAVIMSVLQKKGNELPFKRLQKKVLGEYSEITGQEVDDRIADKFIKKLKSAPNVRVDKNRVLLLD